MDGGKNDPVGHRSIRKGHFLEIFQKRDFAKKPFQIFLFAQLLGKGDKIRLPFLRILPDIIEIPPISRFENFHDQETDRGLFFPLHLAEGDQSLPQFADAFP